MQIVFDLGFDIPKCWESGAQKSVCFERF